MPVEIKELIIRTNIVANQGHSAQHSGRLTEKDKRDLIDSCVSQVIRIIERKGDR
ncbi:MAG: hypothetical protein HWE07_01745 [Cytophagia bacterium]|nr:hypothetical protein [Cytophagia bacterium]